MFGLGMMYESIERVLGSGFSCRKKFKFGNLLALEWILDQYKEKKPKDPTIQREVQHVLLSRLQRESN
jgi:hypothetical protein